MPLRLRVLNFYGSICRKSLESWMTTCRCAMDGAASVKLAPLKQWLLRAQISPRNSKTLRLIGHYLLLHRDNAAT
jgi:hypothetical protein